MRAGGQRGSAVVEFVLVVPLLLVLVLGVVQVALAGYVRTTLTAAAAEGARRAALADSGVEAGVRRTREVLAGSVSGQAVEDVGGRVVRVDGLPTVEITVRARLPVLGLAGPADLVVHGHALVEQP